MLINSSIPFPSEQWLGDGGEARAWPAGGVDDSPGVASAGHPEVSAAGGLGAQPGCVPRGGHAGSPSAAARALCGAVPGTAWTPGPSPVVATEDCGGRAK